MGQNASRELKKPVKDYIVENVVTNDEAVAIGSCSVQGYRHQMEDAHACVSDLLGDGSKVTLALCFDGHGGPGAAIFAAEHFPEMLKTAILASPSCLQKPAELERVIEDTAKALDDRMRKDQHKYVTEMDMEDPGTTCVGALVTATHIALINVGDSRGLVRMAQPGLMWAGLEKGGISWAVPCAVHSYVSAVAACNTWHF
eukprot:TRINITY_DN11470_c1_g3_i3.p2 TRINITY_DN11470_c1_g3~~TRINITY_DN11470_c1_g3_i3.p2  ORF type:complete len:200 (+),score=27.30 TRINITY_DN11470_c1_g3_i3:111-710(+)